MGKHQNFVQEVITLESKRVLGVDPGTANTGYALLEGDQILTFGLLKTDTTDGSVRARIDMIGDALQKIIKEWAPSVLAVEDFTEQGKMVGKTYKEMSWLTEHFRLLGKFLGIQTVIYKNGEWKKRTLGIHRATKQQVQHYVGRHLPEAERILKKAPSHVWDAVGIALCARKHHLH